MKNFVLKNYTGENINKIKASNLSEAIDIFLNIKKLSKEDLLSVYGVEEEKINN
jgi:hypothetical protein